MARLLIVEDDELLRDGLRRTRLWRGPKRVCTNRQHCRTWAVPCRKADIAAADRLDNPVGRIMAVGRITPDRPQLHGAGLRLQHIR